MPDDYVLVVDDEPRYRDLFARVLREAGLSIVTAGDGAEALAVIAEAQGPPRMVVSDVRMPGVDGLEFLKRLRGEVALGQEIPFLLVTAYPDIADAVAALKMGAVDYLQKPIDLDELVTAVRESLGMSALNVGADATEEWEALSHASPDLVVNSPAMRAVLWDAYRVADSDATVLLTGESGTGKGAVAQFIHEQSNRKGHPLVAVNCAAIPQHLLASELFGHERGAFTGADSSRKGRIREAAGGTLFLDEIGDMPSELQPALLHVIETGKIVPVGSDKEVAVDFRLIAATHQDLPTLVSEGRFRNDLYYRLNVIALELPPLRDRRDDVLPMARRFLGHGTQAKRLSRAAVRCLESYAWPGNVRELQNAMERARLLSRTEVVLPEHLPPPLRQADCATQPADSPAPQTPSEVTTLEDAEREVIANALNQTDGNRTKAAELLGISRRGLINKIKRYGLS